MEKTVLLIGLIVVGVAVLAIALFETIDRYKEKKQGENMPVFRHMPKEVSYEKYRIESRRSSVLNGPIRKSGDCYDFIIKYGESIDNAKHVENLISYRRCGELSK